MLQRVDLEVAVVLHWRPYRDTSLLVDFFTRDYGVVSAVAKGVRQAKSRSRALLQPFVPLFISWYGKTDLKSLRTVEEKNTAIRLVGDTLFSGLYLNELLIRILQRQDGYPVLFDNYLQTLYQLQGAQNSIAVEKILRQFEWQLLKELGYEMPLLQSNSHGQNIYPEAWYQVSQQDIQEVAASENLEEGYFKGSDLLAIAQGALDNTQVLKTAKRLMRLALSEHLSKPLMSRSLFSRKSV